MRKSTRKNGVSVAVVLATITILIIVGLSLAYLSKRNLQNVSKDKFATQAFYAAEAGMTRAYTKMKEDMTWNGYDDPPTNKVPTIYNVKMPNSENTFYSVRIYNNITGAVPLKIEENIEVPKENAYIMSEGRFGPASRPKSVKKVGGMLRRASVFDFGVFGKSSLRFNGTILVDAYDSSKGPYDPLNLEKGLADVGTNGSGAGDINFNGVGNMVDGDVVAGPGSDLSNVVSVNPSTWTPSGKIKSLPVAIDFPEVEMPAGIGSPVPIPLGGGPLLPGYYEPLKVSNKDIYVLKNYGTPTNPSVYVFDAIDLSGGAELHIDNTNGPIKIIVNGPCDLRGKTGLAAGLFHDAASVNPNPMDLQIYCTPKCDEVFMRGNSSAYFALYAPDSDVVVEGNSEVNGSIIGDNVEFGGHPPMHYDVGLKTIYDYKILRVGSWQRF